jgi:hypothetical protein
MTTLQPMTGLQTLAPSPSSAGALPHAGAGFAPPQMSDLAPGGADAISNPVAPAISTERRGALRRLIDGIRRR